MNMTVLFKKCTYGVLLITTTIIGLINFGYGDYLNNLQFITNVNYGGGRVYSTTPASLGYPVDEGLICFNIKGYTGGKRLVVSRNGTNYNNFRFQTDLNYAVDLFGCFLKSYNAQTIPIYVTSEGGGNISSFDIDFYFVSSDKYEIVSGNPGYTSLQCQTEYNLIPISSVDQNYCVNNNLCPSCGGGECGGTGNNWSALYINNIQYNGAPNIRVTIPEEIERDNYTDEEETTIDIIGYGYDQEKMQQMVNTQYYKPTAEEMSGLIEKIADFIPLVAVALLITRLRRVIKKVF